MKTAKFFWQYFKQYKLAFLVVMIMIVISTVLQVLFPIFTGLAISELVELGSAFASGKLASGDVSAFAAFQGIMWNLALAFIFLSLSSLIYMLLMSRIISYSTNEMRKGLFGKLARLTVSFFDRHQDGDIFNESLVQVMSNIALYIGLIVIMFMRHATLAWVTIASTPVAIIVLVSIVKLARKYTDLQQKEVGQLNAYMDETISGQKVVIVQGMQEEVIKGFVQQNDKVRSATFRGRAFAGLLFPVMNGMSLINTAIVIFVGSAIMLNDPTVKTSVAIGLISTFTQFSQQYYQPIIQVAASWGSH